MNERINNALEEIRTICEPNCKTEVDYHYLKIVKNHLEVLKGVTERWIDDFNKLEGGHVFLRDKNPYYNKIREL